MSKFKAGDWVKDTKLCRYHIAEVKYPLYVIDNVIYPLKKDIGEYNFYSDGTFQLDIDAMDITCELDNEAYKRYKHLRGLYEV